jgi:hypothetical protein
MNGMNLKTFLARTFQVKQIYSIEEITVSEVHGNKIWQGTLFPD